ncbi:MAG: nucleotidyltransferase domain-containing protein [Deltaproteobacteria bacterium]|nr:nucleotidyltransferase domain-containing protein [Deltaproteobacteria bacterium]
MDKKAALSAIISFKAALESKGIRISKLILYGSYAAGTFKEGSDIDLVVVSDDFAEKGYWERIGILSDAIYEVFEPIEAVAMTTDEWRRGDSSISEYSKNGELVFAA